MQAPAKCTLERDGLARQRERYRQAGLRAFVLERSARLLVIQLDERVDAAQVDEIVAIERECCPFFALEWDRETRRFSASVSGAQDEPALAALCFAFGLRAAAAAGR